MQQYLNHPDVIKQRLHKLLNQHDPELAHQFQQENIKLRRGFKLNWQDRYLLVLFSILGGLLLLASMTAEAAESWGLEFSTESENGRQAVSALALNTSIEVEVIGSQARVVVQQNFHNSSDQWAEASYRFPLPDTAAIDQLQIQVGERTLLGEIQEKQQAEVNYQQASANGQTASLVVQERANQFHTRLANIGPGEDISVQIGFLMPVLFADGQFKLRLPMTFTPASTGAETAHQNATQNISENSALNFVEHSNDHKLMLTVNLITDFELSDLNSRYHAINVHETLQGYYIILEDQLTDGRQHAQAVQTDRDFELVWSLQEQDQPMASVLTWEDQDGFYAQLQLVPPRTDMIDERPREVIFIIDTSGSMAGVSIRQAQIALLAGLQKLRPEDRFNIIRFDSRAEQLFDTPVAVSAANIDRANAAIHALNADGGTNIKPALVLALDSQPPTDYLRQIVFLTDGAVGNEDEIFQYLYDNLDNSRLFTIAIGAAPNSWFMRKAAEIGRGSFIHIGALDEIVERMDKIWQRISQPALENICIDWGQPAEMYPAITPDLYAGDSLFITARMETPPTEVRLCGQLNGQDWEFIHALPKRHASADVARLWARKKIETINDNQLLGLAFDEARAQILAVALNYHLLSPFTALVAIDPQPARAPQDAMTKARVASLMPGNKMLNLAQGALGWEFQALLSILALAVSGGMFWRSGVGKDD